MDEKAHKWMEERETRRIKKYRGKRCVVCGKWGANEPFGEPLSQLIYLAFGRKLTLRGVLISTPEDRDTQGIHEKCLIKLKLMVIPHGTRLQA